MGIFNPFLDLGEVLVNNEGTSHSHVKVFSGDETINMAPGGVPSPTQTASVTYPSAGTSTLCVIVQPTSLGDSNRVFVGNGESASGSGFTLRGSTADGLNYSFGQTFRWVAFVAF